MTQTLLHIALSNAAVAAVLAVVALAVTVALRRPALSHAAWLLVLLKLLTPPLFTVPVEWPTTAVSKIVPEPMVEQWVAPEADLSQQIEAGLIREEPVVDDAMEAQPLVAEEAITPVTVEEPSVWARVRPHWARVLVGAWAFGSSMVLILIASRLYRFRRVLRHATPARDDVQEQARSLCEDLDIRPAPSVFFVPGGVCPMLIGFGRASRILVPRELWWHLDDNQRATLLVHELAHLRRGDQWVRLIELLVTVLYWWNPVAWFARRELREAEEQCCDAWVVWAMPHSARDYAVALMESIDMTTRARPVVPVLGSGMGEFHHLRRRLIMIKQGKVARALTWSGSGAMCGVGALLLPLSPTLAEPERPKEAPADVFSVVERLDEIEGFALVEQPVAVEAVPAAPAAPAAVIVEGAGFEEDVQFDIQIDSALNREIDGELKEAREEVRQLSQELARASQRLSQLEQRRHGAMVRGMRPGPSVTLRGARTVQPRPTPPVKAAPDANDPAAVPPDKIKPARPVMPKFAPGGGPMNKGPMPGWEGGRGDGQEKRLDMLEERLAELLDEVRSLKQQQRNEPNQFPGKAPPPQKDVVPEPEAGPRLF